MIFISSRWFFSVCFIFPVFLVSDELDGQYPDIVLSNYIDFSSEIAWNEGAGIEYANEELVVISTELPNSDALFSDIELLLWKGRQTSLGFLMKHSPGGSEEKNEVKNLKLNGNFGEKFGFSYPLDDDGWNVEGSYSHARSKVEHLLEDPVIGLSGSEGEAPGIQSLEDATAIWRMDVQMSDIEVGRDLSLFPQMSLRPHFGLRGAWIVQHYANSRMDGEDETNHFFGAGARIGCDSIWEIYKGFSLFGDGAFSVLSRVWDIPAIQSDSAGQVDPLNQVDRSQTLLTLVDLACGLKYDLRFADQRYRFAMKMGYEYNYILNQMQFTKSSAASLDNPSSLSLMGWRFGIELDF
jgi:hypothetical protein